jgi:hypothetical protein
VFYQGTEDQWNQVKIEDNNALLTDSYRHYGASGIAQLCAEHQRCADCCAQGNHVGEATETPPTCTQEGKRILTCLCCGEIVTEAIPATGHSGEPVETPPTCTQEGFVGYTCQICGEKVVQEQLAATGHSFGSWEFDWSSGKNVRSCHCGEKEYRASALYPILAVGAVLLVAGVILLVMRRKRTKA